MAGLFRVYARRPFLFTTPTPVSSSICHISDHWHSRLLRASRERPCGRYNPKQRDEVAAPHGGLPQGKDHELSITGQPVHRSKSRPLMSGQGRVSRVSPVQTAMRNCTRDEGGPFEVGNQVLISSHRKLLLSKAMVVSVAETPGQDSGRQG